MTTTPKTTPESLTTTFQREIDPKGWLDFGKQAIPASVPRWAARTDRRRRVKVMDFFRTHLAPYKPTSKQVRAHDLDLYKKLQLRYSQAGLNDVMPSDSFINQQLLSGLEARYGADISDQLRRSFIGRQTRSKNRKFAHSNVQDLHEPHEEMTTTPKTTIESLTITFQREIALEDWMSFGKQAIPESVPRWADRADRQIDVMDFFSTHLAPYKPTKNQVRAHDFDLYHHFRQRYSQERLNAVMPSNSVVSQQLLASFEDRYGTEVSDRLRRAFIVHHWRSRQYPNDNEPDLHDPA